MGEITLQGFVCERCGHRWVKRETTEGLPVICPKCKSPYWNRPKASKAPKQDRSKEKTLKQLRKLA